MLGRVGRWLTGQPIRAVSRIQMLVCALVLFVPLASSSEARAVVLSWPSSLQSAPALTLQSGADQAGLTSTACWSANSCVAVGEDDVSGAERAIVVPELDGVPGQAVAVTLPALAQLGSSEVATLNGVSCSTNGACVAVGEYEDTSGVTDALVVPITGGVPSGGLEVMPPGASGESYLRGVSCPATGTCVAVGTYGIDSNSYQEGVVVPINDGVPGAAAEVSPPSNADAGAPSVSVNSVSCWSDGSCLASGQYQSDPSNGALYPMVVPISGGVPATGLEVKLPGDAYTDTAAQQSVLASVSCQPTGSCVAVGSYVDTSGGSRPLVVAISGDVPSAAREVGLPARAGGAADGARLSGVSCPPSGSCSAVGSYEDTGGNTEPLIVPLLRGVAGAGLEAKLPANQLHSSTGYQDASLGTVSCPLSGSCLAVGDYYDASDDQQALVVPISGGASGAGNEAALQPIQVANPSASLAAVSCAASGSCVAIGQHDDATGQMSSVAYSLQTPLSISTSRLTGTKLGTVYSATLAATGAWGSYTWSVASGRLPVGLSLNAQTGVISGRLRTPVSRRPTFRATGTGDPAQTVIKALSIRFDGPVLNVFLGRGGPKVSGGDVGIRVSCSNMTCRGSLKLVYTHEVTLSHHRHVREQTVIGSSGYALSAGRSRTVTIKLSAAGLTFLQDAKNQRLEVVLDVRVRGGMSTSKDTAIIAATTKTRRQR